MEIIAGGQMTMTVGFVSVIISLIIGIIVGGISGYYAGKIDIGKTDRMSFHTFRDILDMIVIAAPANDRTVVKQRQRRLICQYKVLYFSLNLNYAIDADGNVTTWGLKGYLFGTDNLGRSVALRILKGVPEDDIPLTHAKGFCRRNELLLTFCQYLRADDTGNARPAQDTKDYHNHNDTPYLRYLVKGRGESWSIY